MEDLQAMAVPLTIGAIVFLTVLVFAWILLPFAMFGMKGLLRQLIQETRRTNDLLDASLKRQNNSLPPPSSGPPEHR